MKALIRLLNAPALERLQMRVTGPVFSAALVGLFCAVFFGLPVLLGVVTGRLAKAFEEGLWIFLLFPIIPTLFIFVWFTGAHLCGRLTGYRPFVFRWTSLSVHEAEILCERARDSARALGFDVVWQKRLKGFLGRLGAELELENMEKLRAIQKVPNAVPTRLYVTMKQDRLGQYAIKLLLTARGIVWRDTGERACLAELGQWMVASADGRATERSALRHALVNPSPELAEARKELPSREAFAPLAEKYRNQEFRLLIALVGSLIFTFAFLTQIMPDRVAGIVWFVSAAGLMVWLHPKMPNCPMCSKAIDELWGPYCPDCGGRFRPAQTDWNNAPPRSGPICESCGKKLSASGRRRNFKYRACTHCGAQLDAKGL